jgi:hypothetical protein
VTRAAARPTSVGGVTATRVRAVAALALGCALAAAAAGTGPYLVSDRDVPAFHSLFRRAAFRTQRRQRRNAVGELLRHYGHWVDVATQAVFLLIAVAVVAVAVWQAARLLARLAALRLARSQGLREGAAYDAGDGTDEDAETSLRHRVADELVALSAELETEADAREAVIACYVRMERALADAGSPRHPTESPLELLDRVLGAHDVPEHDAQRLTGLFTEARFSTHRITPEMRDAARRSLAAIADALTVSGTVSG